MKVLVVESERAKKLWKNYKGAMRSRNFDADKAARIQKSMKKLGGSKATGGERGTDTDREMRHLRSAGTARKMGDKRAARRELSRSKWLRKNKHKLS